MKESLRKSIKIIKVFYIGLLLYKYLYLFKDTYFEYLYKKIITNFINWLIKSIK